MSYCIARSLGIGFDDAIARVREELSKEGFGVLTEIDVKATMKKKLDVDFSDYVILGACNPPFALRALEAEPRIGTMLPCNVIVRRAESGETEIAAIDPVVSMQAVDNPSLRPIADEIRTRLARVVDAI